MPAVQLEKLRLNSLEDFDPRLEALFQKHLQTIAADCIFRPGEKVKRKLTLEFIFEPELDPESKELDRVHITVEAKSKVPTYRSKTLQLDCGRDGFRFNAGVPENLDQTRLPYKEE